MKQFLLTSILRSRLPLAALALGFALLAPPARAISIDGDTDLTIPVGDTAYVSFSCEQEEVSSLAATVRISATPSDAVTVFYVQSDGTLVRNSTIPMYETSNGVRFPVDSGTIAIRGEKVTTTSATVTLKIGANTATLNVSVVAENKIQVKDASGNPIGATLSFGEGDSRTVLFTPAQNVTVTCSATDADAADHLSYTVMPGTINLTGLDGLWNCQLTFSADGLDPASLFVVVTNKPPRVSGGPSPEEAVPVSKALKKKTKDFHFFDFSPSDPGPKDQSKLSLTWSLSAGTLTAGDPDAVLSYAWQNATDEDSFEYFSVTVSDGDESYTGWYKLKVDDTVTLFTDTASPLTALTRQGGIAQDTEFRVFDSDGNELDWTQVDGRTYHSMVPPKETLTLRAILEPDAYPFGWFSEKNADAFKTPTLRVPNSALNATVQMPEDESIAIQYLASYPYYHTTAYDPTTDRYHGAVNGLNNVWTDPFGDFDADGLSDVWEDYYFQDEMDTRLTSPQEARNFPVGMTAGEYGASGNIDDDWLPTKVVEAAPDGNDKAGWPVDREGETHRVFVLKYPLDFGSGGESYYKGDREEKPTFDNFIEYRGLLEDRVGDGTDPMNLVRYAPDFVDRTTRSELNGENCSGTNPKNPDTDGDGFSDGWEYYFWTTIKYGVHAENWRCWDPSYTYYSTASAQAGFPMLETDDPPAFDFDVDPTPSYEIDHEAGTYLTYYEVTKKILNDNDVVLPIVPGSVEITFDGSEFVLYTLSRGLADYIGVNPKDQDGNDRLFYIVYVDTDGDGVLDSAAIDPNTGYFVMRAVDGAWVNDLTGQMYIPGWQKLVQLDGAVSTDITQTTAIHVAFERQNGLFPKSFLLSRFDPMNWDEYLAGDIPARITAAGFNPDNWDPYSDLDGDGVNDVEEYFLGTDPLHWDTDRDGMPDGWEVMRGLLPTDPRSRVNGCGPGDNPDQDYMAYDATGTAIHADAYWADLSNEVYWNGKSFVGYRPGRAALPSDPVSFQMHYEQGLRTVDLTVMAAFGGGPFSNLQEFLYSFYGITHGFWPEVYPFKGDYNWSSTTTNPCNNDTDGDGLPDGWEPYVGYSPIVPLSKTPMDLMEGLGYNFNPRLEQPPACQGPAYNPDLDYDQDYDETVDLSREFCCLWVNMLWPETTTEYIGGWTWDVGVDHRTRVNPQPEGTEVVINGFEAYPGWYNKWMPTDPWNADTDCDGLTDFQEYIDLADGNGDGEPKCNFNPTQVDTDLDWLPDGWERLMNLYSYQQLPNLDAAFIDDEYGPFGDPDGDKLANYQEYLTGANYGWRHDKWYPLDKENIWVPQVRTDDETQKWDPMTPWDFPYDPGLYPEYGPTVRAHVYSPVDFFSVPVSGTTIARGMETLKALEKRWGYTVADSPSIEMETLAARFQRVYELMYNFQAARDIPIADANIALGYLRDEVASLFLYDTDPDYDPDYNYDGMHLPGKVYWYHHSQAEHDQIVALFENVRSWIYSYAQCGYGWDLSGSLVNSGVYMPLNANSLGYGFPGTRPLSVDSDNDGMPDYWEIYHGLNPTYGGARLLAKAGDLPDGDRADKDSWGDGSTDNWIMGYDPTYVLNLNFAMRPPYAWPIARKAKTGWWTSPEGEWVPYSFDDAITTAFGPDMDGNYIMEWSHYDLVNRPWLSGDKSADADKDGLNNQEEAYSFFANDLWSHTDPSPYWLTDMSQTVGRFGQNASHVNLYYQAADYGAALIWWWAVPFNGGVGESPQYVWDFETNEGFDTDNDNIGDREEMASVSSRGKTDPQNFDSPISRKAMYFDGHAACRTQRPFFHDQYALTSHTVEFWVRPHEYPQSGRISTLIHRPVMMPVDTLSGSKAWEIRNTFHIYMDELGRVFGQVDNDGIEQAANSAVVMSAGRLVLDKWAHIAMVMDSQNDDLALYINGEFAGHVACSLKPCTGIIMSSSYREWLTSNGGGSNGLSTASTTTVNFDWSPAPIVLGAFEKNPWGVVGGKLWSLTETQFDANRFFDGWIDEVRIWDRCRTQTQIMNDMTKRYKAADVEKINRKRWVWDKDHLYATDAEADFPQKILYHYSFDNMPDVARPKPGDRVPARDDATAFFTDTDPVPLGWDVTASIRPVPFVPWWYLADNRSTAYATDFSYIPFVENTVSHLAQRPSRDISEVVPVYNPVDSSNPNNNWKFLGYRYRRSTDWATENQAAIEIGGWQYVDFLYYPTNVLGEMGPTDISYYAAREDSGLIPESLLINTMNPYGDGYNTHVRGSFEYNPWNFGGELDRYGVYEGVPIHSDMVPLLDAVADIDVPMWDGAGPGWDNAAIDSDGDGLPDFWEIAFGLDPNDATGFNGAYGDRDNDGLDNWAEYLAGTDPFAFDTDSDGYSDYYSRPDGGSLTFGELYDDGDGMDNAWEIEHGLDPNRFDANEDLDGDGWTNWEEYMAHKAHLAYIAHSENFDRVPSDADPLIADVFPQPWFNVTFLYDGERVNDAEGSSATPYVRTFGEKTAGRNMGGYFDGMYHPYRQQLNFADPQYNIPMSIGGATVVFDEVWQLDGYPVGGNAEITLMVNGSARVCKPTPYDKDPDYGLLAESDSPPGLALLRYSTGQVLLDGAIGFGNTAIYSVGGRTFPYTVRGMSRLELPNPDLLPYGWNQYLGGHNHMVSGWNRFMGWLDLDGDLTWTPGEPMGISQPRPTEVSWDSVETTIPLTDSVWDFARLKWPDVNPVVQEAYGSDVIAYFVNFSWVRGATQSEETESVGGGDANYATTGDLDHDGLEDWMENLAGTPTNTPAIPGEKVGTNDYYRIDPVSGFSYGELYDDGDGIPTAWELKYPGYLDPYRNDAKADPDDDGWSNWAEFMAGTEPDNSSSYPHPKFSVTFDYHGQETDLVNLGVYTYGQMTQGETWGGSFDGRYNSTKGFGYKIVLGSDGIITYDKYSDVGVTGTFNYTRLKHGLIDSASINVYVQNQDGTTEIRSFTMQEASAGLGIFTQDELGWILIERESGRVLVNGDYAGMTADINTTVKSYAFPVTFSGLVRNPVGTHTHMVEGPNRFFGWMDLDGNETYDQGEPCGLSVWGPTLVGWDSVSTEIPLTDTLWDYPRISWNDFVPSNFTPRVYIVNFTAEGKTSTGEGTSKQSGIYGDLDGDGLDAWMEAQADTILNDMDSDDDGRMDYDSVDKNGLLDPDKKFTFGEWLDDGDGMPAEWEIAYGIEPYYDLDPHLFDAQKDLDDDGWSNWAEFMANTDPSNPDSFPEPNLAITFRYDGEVDGASKIKVFAYSEKVEGDNLAENPDPKTIYMGGQRDGLYMTQSKSVGIWGDYSLTYEALNTDWGASFIGGRGIVSATLVWFGVDGTEYKQDMQSFASNPDYGFFIDDGTARIFIEKSTGMILTQFYEQDLDASSIEGDELIGGNGVGVQPARSSVYAPNYTVEYSVAGKDYPMTIPHLSRGDLLSKHNHMMEGYNRFLAFMDMNANDEWDEGEPMGLSLYDATLVGYDSVIAEVPLTDGLFGFERIKWPSDPAQWEDPEPAATNLWNTRYRIFIENSAKEDAVPEEGLCVEYPRNFLHEGDYIEASGEGLKFSSVNDVFTYKVMADDGNYLKMVSQGTFRHIAGEARTRRATEAIYPVEGNVIHGSLVDFQWKMDSRTQGVKFTVTKTDGADAGVKINDLYVPFPVRHNKVNDDDYYYSYIPQLKDGRTLVEFPDGYYTYKITPYINQSSGGIGLSSDPSMSPIEGKFQVLRGTDNSRDHASISGNIHYYGRMAGADGSFATGNLTLQAYKLPDDATTAIQISGNPIMKQTGLKAGPFTLDGFTPGRYALFAFVDVNGNGIADVGETQGMGFLGLDRPASAEEGKNGGSAIPVQLPEWFDAIEIRVGHDSSSDGQNTFAAAIDVEDVHIVLRDRDLNGDKLPELAKAAGIDLATYKGRSLQMIPATKNFEDTGTHFSTNWPTLYWFDKAFHPVSSRSTPGTPGGGNDKTYQFAVQAPRTFLHEGDLARTGLYGFPLGENNALNVSWNVIATDGYHSQTNDGGSFSVYAGQPFGTSNDPDPRREMKPRWPTQNTVVHGSVVDFEWEMDFRNAGVTFVIERIDTAEVVVSNTIPFPVMHWDPTVQNYYYVARPQMENGLRFIELPDGAYRYTIIERTNTDAVPKQWFSETFQIRNAENTRTTGSIEGDIWYYGRSTIPNTEPPEWKNDLLIRAYKVSDEASSSASVGGMIVAESVQRTNGAFRLEGLESGTYAVHAFVDSNGNGIADDWETQGFGVYGGNASPVVIASAAYPIVVTNGASVIGVNVVLHDRDTDRDLLPDVWEWEKYGCLTNSTGYDLDPSNAYTRLTLPDPSVLTNWIWKIDLATIITRVVDTPVKDSLRVRVDNPRTFLHEGDFLTPYVLKNNRKGEREEGTYSDGSLPENAIPYLFKEVEKDGVLQWQPYDRPYYGFELGSYSNSMISWTVEAWDGAETWAITGGTFRVASAVGEQRQPLVAKYPTQGTVLHGETVEFEWKMDDHNAGVLFSLWKIGEYTTNVMSGVREIEMLDPDPSDGEDLRIQVITNMVIAFPVRHGLPGTEMTYYSAVPQLDDGLQEGAVWTPDIGKLPIRLPGDGLYEYTITERPRIGTIPNAFNGPLSFTERFQLDNADNPRGLYSASGTIRYYGKVMEAVELGVTLSRDDDRPEQWTAVVPAALMDEINPGAVAVYVKEGDDVREAFNDSAADGILYAIGGTNNLAWSGDIEYPFVDRNGNVQDGNVRVLFSGTQVAGDPILMAKRFPVPLYLQVYRLADEAETCTSISGVPVQQIRKDTKGKFEIKNLEQGKYAIRAFIDSNGNGYCDDWETQGVAVKTGTVSPNIDAGAAPIVVGGSANNASGLMIVLHDRDTDNDLLPDAWEWWKAEGTLLRSGFEPSAPGGLLWVQEYADGVLDSDPRTPDTDLDGLTDAMEILVTKTDTHLRDTDGDGIGDMEEFLSGSDPLNANVAIPYTIPALEFASDGTPFVDIAYPALRPGVTLAYELQRKLSLADEEWETVCEYVAKNTGVTVSYSEADGVNSHMSPAGTVRMLPADLAEDPDLDFSTGFFRVKVFADYGEMVDNGDGTWSYWTWVQDGPKSYVYRYREAARGEGTLVRDANGNWSFVSDSTGMKGVLVRDEDGNWSFQN